MCTSCFDVHVKMCVSVSCFHISCVQHLVFLYSNALVRYVIFVEGRRGISGGARRGAAAVVGIA